MKAVVIRTAGGLENLEIAERPEPRPGTGQIVVQSSAIGVNYGDILLRRGLYPMELRFPYVPGFEVVGTVRSVGEGVTGYREGMRIAAMTYGGAYAEQVLVDAANVLPAPDAVGSETLLALMSQGLTAWGLLDVSRMERGHRVLVHSAAGGVGDLLVQLAKARGASMVIGAASNDAKLERARASGAVHVVNYTQAGWAEQVRKVTDGGGVDALFDAVGGSIRNTGLSLLASFGRAVIYGASSGDSLGLSGEQITALGMASQSIVGFVLLGHMRRHPEFVGAAWSGLTTLAAEGHLRVAHQTMPLDDVRRAHAAMERRETIGKLVLVP